jgi:hypothetical protein
VEHIDDLEKQIIITNKENQYVGDRKLDIFKKYEVEIETVRDVAVVEYIQQKVDESKTIEQENVENIEDTLDFMSNIFVDDANKFIEQPKKY